MNQQTDTTIIKDSIGVTLASFFVILINSILITGCLSRLLGDENFESYLFIRRWIAWVFPITTLSIGVGIKYYSAINDKDHISQKNFLKASILCLVAVSLILLVLFLCIPGIYSFMIPGEKNYSTLIPSLLIWLLGFSSYSILYSWFCGIMKFQIANLILIIFNAVIPAGIVLYSILFNVKMSIPIFLGCWGMGYCISFIILFFNAGNLFTSISETIDSCKKLLKYSLPRIPAGFLTAFPAYFIAKTFSVFSIDLLPFLSGVMLFQLIHYASDPLGNVLMPRSARSRVMEPEEKRKSDYGNLIEFFFTIGILILPQVAVWGAIILNIWLKTPIAEFKIPIYYLTPVLIPVIMYVPLRSLLDSIEEKALTTHFLTYGMIALLTIVAIFIFLDKYSLFAGILAFCTGKYTFLILSLREIKKKVSFSISISFLFFNSIFAVMLGTVNFYLARFLDDSSTLLEKILLLSLGILIFSLSSIIWIKQMRTKWLNMFLVEITNIYTSKLKAHLKKYSVL